MFGKKISPGAAAGAAVLVAVLGVAAVPAGAGASPGPQAEAGGSLKISGKVIAPAGQSLRDAELSVSTFQAEPRRLADILFAIGIRRIGSDGSYSITVRPGAYKLIIYDDSDKFPNQWYRVGGNAATRSDASVVTVTDTSLSVNIALTAGTWISGKVIAPAGQSLRGADLTVVAHGASGDSGGADVKPDGSYRVPVFPGDFKLEVRDSSGEFPNQWYRVGGNAANESDASVVKAPADGVAMEVAMELVMASSPAAVFALVAGAVVLLVVGLAVVVGARRVRRVRRMEALMMLWAWRSADDGIGAMITDLPPRMCGGGAPGDTRTVERLLTKTGLPFAAEPTGWTVTIPGGPLFVTMEAQAGGSPSLRLTMQVRCEVINESDVAAISDQLGDYHLFVARSETGEQHVWVGRDLKDSPLRGRHLRRLIPSLRVIAAMSWNVLAVIRVMRLLEAVMRDRMDDPACQVNMDSNGDWWLKTEGLPPVIGNLTHRGQSDESPLVVFRVCRSWTDEQAGFDSIAGDFEYQLSFGTGWIGVRENDATRETLAGLESAHPGVDWESAQPGVDWPEGIDSGNSFFTANVRRDVSRARTKQDVEEALGALQTAAAEVGRRAEALGITTWDALVEERLADERRTTRARDDWRNEIIEEELTRIAQESEGVELLQYDSYDPGRESARVVLRDSQDEGGSRLLFATLDDAGDLRIRGDDAGPAVTAHFGESFSRTEWVDRIDARDVPALLSHLGAGPGEPTLAAIARFADRVENALLVDEAVPFHRDNWES